MHRLTAQPWCTGTLHSLSAQARHPGPPPTCSLYSCIQDAAPVGAAPSCSWPPSPGTPSLATPAAMPRLAPTRRAPAACAPAATGSGGGMLLLLPWSGAGPDPPPPPPPPGTQGARAPACPASLWTKPGTGGAAAEAGAGAEGGAHAALWAQGEPGAAQEEDVGVSAGVGGGMA